MNKQQAATSPTDEVSDQALIERYLQGEDKAFDTLYQRYRRPVFAYLHGMLPGRQELAEELFQQTWVKVVKSLRRYRDRNSFIAWILRIARNAAMDYFRSQSRWSALERQQDWLEDPAPSPRQAMIDRQEQQQLLRAIDQLPTEQREVVLMRLQDLPFKEIAQVQGTSINTALGRMRYAILNLKEKMKS